MNLFVISEPYAQWGMQMARNALGRFALHSWLRPNCSFTLRAMLGWIAVRHVKGLHFLLPTSSPRKDRINGIERPKG